MYDFYQVRISPLCSPSSPMDKQACPLLNKTLPARMFFFRDTVKKTRHFNLLSIKY